ncbi:MAG: hypothetical protein HQM10_09350 [Candidatus Riflebacteria bacterium]|nr:hypothetical protein [Candidatus Riflebacteria bacterium]
MHKSNICFNLGIATPVTLLVMALLSIIFLSSTFLIRNSEVVAVHYYSSEVALNLAEAGVEDVLSALRFERVPDGVHGSDFRKFYDDLLSQPPDGKYKSHYVYVPGKPVQDAIAAVNSQTRRGGVSANLKMKLILSNMKPIKGLPWEAGLSMTDSVEKRAILQIQSIGNCSGVEREMNVIKNLSVVNVIHPQLSKFSLFIAHPPATPDISNLLMQSDSNPLDYTISVIGGQRAAPIVINNGESTNLKTSGFSALSTNTLLQNALIYLGGTWKVGVAGGERQNLCSTSERFLLRMAAYNITGVLNLIGLNENPQITKITQLMFGCKADFMLKDLQGADKVFPIETTMAYKFSSLEPDFDISRHKGSFAFRLFGTAEKYSPAIVLGDVVRHFLLLNTMDGYFISGGSNSFTDVPAPYMPECYLKYMKRPDASPNNLPSSMNDETKNIIWSLHALFKTNDSGELAKLKPYYRGQIMSRVQYENVNMAHDYVFSNKEAFSSGKVMPAQNIPVIPGDGDSSAVREAIEKNQHPILRVTQSISKWSTSDELKKADVQLNGASGQPIFRGKLEEIRGFDELVARAVVDFSSAADFWKVCSMETPGSNGKKVLYVPGVAHVVGSLTIDAELLVKGGGIIVCDGDITINASILDTPGEPLTLCSGRTITIGTSQPIHAALIALRSTVGMLTAASDVSSFSIFGHVAAWDANYRELTKNDGRKNLSYPKEQFDETVVQTREPHFPHRIILADNHRVFFRGIQ